MIRSGEAIGCEADHGDTDEGLFALQSPLEALGGAA